MAINKLEQQNILLELKKTFKGRLIPTILMVIVSIAGGIFCSGLIYQYISYTFGKLRHFLIINSFYYGMSRMMLVSFILAGVMFYGYYKFLRMIGDKKVNYEDNIVRSEKETYGGAHWQSEEELKENFTISKRIEDTTEEIFGCDEKGHVYSLTYPAGMNHNRAFFGAPGSGKTSAIIKTDIYQCIRRGESIITTDSKGAIYAETSAVAKKNGYTIKVFNLKNNEFKNSNAFNVMDSLDPTDQNFASDCAVISNIIIKNTQGDKPLDYWAMTETVALQMTIMLLASRPEYINSHQNNLYGVFEFLSTKSAQEITSIFKNLPLTSPTRMAYENFSKASPQNQGQTLNGLTTRLGILNNPIFKEVLGKNEIDLLAPMQKPCIYYVIIPDNDDTYKFLASLFFSTIFKKQCDYSDNLTPEEKKKQLTVFYELDEYKNIGGIINLDTKISTVRSRKINITIILQLLNQLITVHDEDKAKEILNGCTVKSLLSTNDYDTAKYFSDLLGTYTALSEGERFDEAKTNVVKLHNDIKKNISEAKRELAKPEELMNDKMARDELIYVIANMAPARLKKCFAEKNGIAIHPMEKEGIELGYRQSSHYRPKWRKELEESKPVSITPEMKPEIKPALEETEEKPFSEEMPFCEEPARTIKEEKPEEPKVITLTEVDEPKPKEPVKTGDQKKNDKLSMLLNGQL